VSDAPAHPRPARWPWLIFGAFILAAGAGTYLVAVLGESVAQQVPLIIAFAMFGVVGALIVSREPGNRIGWLLLWGSGMTAAGFVAGEMTTYLVLHGRADTPLAVAAALVSNAGWVVGIIPVLFFLPLLFPDGHLPSRRWVPFGWFCVAVLAFAFVAMVFATKTLTGSVETARVDNPLYIETIDRFEIPDPIFTLLLLAILVGSVSSLIVRFRRAEGDQRQQIKWVALALALLVFSFVLSSILEGVSGHAGLVDAIINGAAFLAIPVSIGVAVLRYRLYELDVVVKKALVAGALAVFVVAVYGALVWVFGAVASGRENSASLFVIALLLGLAFRPVARFARRAADRLVYGRRATPYEVLTEFSGRIGDAYATEDVLGRMAQILGEATGAECARVWLVVGGRLVPEASWPTKAGLGESLAIRDHRVDVPGETAVEVREAGELLGALSVAMPANDPMTPAKERLIQDLASQAGLVLRNVSLVEELRAAHRRLVTAQDQERRRLERNIHDGAQQQLVALSVKTRLARDLTPRDPARAAEMLTQIDGEIQTALEDLRDLARGIYPPLLADKGLEAALDAQARRSVVPVSVRADGVGRYPPEVEAAVYFSCLEALQNVAKYAEASSAQVTIAQSNGDLTFEVEDDGRGFDTAATRFGTGLQGIADRLSALHGELAIRSEPGTGTLVRGRVEVGA
jgi:signal transduction histidine kinase